MAEDVHDSMTDMEMTLEMTPSSGCVSLVRCLSRGGNVTWFLCIDVGSLILGLKLSW